MPPPRRSHAGPRWLLGATLIAGAIVALAVPLPASLIESHYSRGVYPSLQRLLTPLSNLVPFALLDLAAAIAIAAWVRQAVRMLGAPPRVPAAARLAFQFVVFAAVVYLLFLAMWGLNYRRVPLERKLPFDASRITREAALRVGREAVALVNQHYQGAHAGADSLALADAFAAAQRALGAGATAVPGIPKRSLLGLYFRWAAIDGMTDPFFLEIILNPDVLPVERPFVVAHEWAHLAGYADESEANFVAWLTCARGDALARYSGWLALYGHLGNALPRADRLALAALLGPGPRQDILAINARLVRSKPVVRRAARDVYDSYLRANRVEQGIESYEAVVRLVLGTTFDAEWTPALAR
jgi:uncharacterized protein DUF3810